MTATGIATVPTKKNDKAGQRDRFDLRLDPGLVARCARQARRLGLTLSSYIRMAMTKQVEQDEATDPKCQG